MSMEHHRLERQCLETARRGVEWLLGQQSPDGSWRALDKAPIDAYYKAAWAFNITGQPAAAERALNYVRQNLLQPDGDLLPRNDPWYVTVHYQYANAWIVIGAQKQGRYDVSMPALKFLLTQQDPSHGGFYSLKSNAGEKKRSDTMSSGISGIACLATGQIDAARKLAGHLQKIAEMQPEPQSRFYLTIEADGSDGIRYHSANLVAGKAGGAAWTAHFDGKAYPVTGTSDYDSVTVQKVDNRTFHLQMRKHGELTVDLTYTVAADGKSLTRKGESHKDGKENRFDELFDRQ